MPKHLCPLCSTMTIQTAESISVCPLCETSVRSMKLVTIIQPPKLVAAR